jgi:hypothetical protein
MLRQSFIAVALAALVGAVVSGQAQRSPAALDDLLTEVRGMRADINRAAAVSMQAQETNSEILAPLRGTIDQLQRRERELRAEESELSRLLRAEEERCRPSPLGLPAGAPTRKVEPCRVSC